jgi:hypothetical protein
MQAVVLLQVGGRLGHTGTAQFKFEVLNHWPDPANEQVFSDLMKQHADLPPKHRLEEVLGDFVKVCK